MHKKAIELSVNFLVMFLLAIVIFGLSVVFIYRLFGDAQETLNVTQSQIDEQIDALLCSSSERVCISRNAQEINRNQYGVFGVFVYNYFQQPIDFDVTVQFADAFDNEGQRLTVSTSQQAYVIGGETALQMLAVGSGTQASTGVGVAAKSDTPSGTYVYNVQVTPYIAGTRDQPPGAETTVRRLRLTVR